MDNSGRLMFSSSAAAPCRAAGVGGGQMLLFGGSGSFLGGSPVVAGVEDDGRRKRPFLTTPEEELQLDDYEMYGYGYSGLDEQGPERKRRLTAEQVRALERSFEEEKRKLEPERKSELARRLGMAPRQVAVWFQNRRARWKTKQLEQDFDRLKAAYDALAADHHGVISDNDRLRAQVISLTEKLQGKETSPLPSATAATAQEVDQLDCTAIAMATPAAQQLKEDILSSGTNDGSSPVVIDEGTNHSGESTYTAGDYGYNGCVGQYYGGGALSSEEEDGGAVSDEGCSFHLPDVPDAMFAAAGIVHHAAEEEAQLGSWSSWFWND